MRPAETITFRRIAALAAMACGVVSPHVALGYVVADRWENTASGSAGVRGEPVTLTWSLVPDGTPIADRGSSSLTKFLDVGFGVTQRSGEIAQRSWFPVLQAAFDRWSALGGVSFVYEPHDDGALLHSSQGALGVRGDVRLAAAPADGPGNSLASSQYPDGGDVVLDADEVARFANAEANYLRLRNVLMHEIGHALGLDHVVSSDASFLMEQSLSVSFDGPQLDDVRGLHFLYGDRFERALGDAGNGAAALAIPLGSIATSQAVSVGADAGSTTVRSSMTDFASISGRGDVDYYSFAVTAPLRIDVELKPRGGRYRQAAVGGIETLIDAGASSSLTLQLYDSNQSLIANLENPLRGASEVLDDLLLPSAGTYFVRISGSRDRAQLYELTLQGNALHAPEPTAAALAWGVLCASSPFRRFCQL